MPIQGKLCKRRIKGYITMIRYRKKSPPTLHILNTFADKPGRGTLKKSVDCRCQHITLKIIHRLDSAEHPPQTEKRFPGENELGCNSQKRVI